MAKGASGLGVNLGFEPLDLGCKCFSETSHFRSYKESCSTWPLVGRQEEEGGGKEGGKKEGPTDCERVVKVPSFQLLSPHRPVHPFTQPNESSQSPTFITSQKPTTQNATTVSSSTKSWCLYLASSSLYNLSSENNCFSSRCPSLALAESHSYSFINIY